MGDLTFIFRCYVQLDRCRASSSPSRTPRTAGTPTVGPHLGTGTWLLVLLRHGGDILSHSRVGIIAIAGNVGTVNGIPAGTARYGREDPMAGSTVTTAADADIAGCSGLSRSSGPLPLTAVSRCRSWMRRSDCESVPHAAEQGWTRPRWPSRSG